MSYSINLQGPFIKRFYGSSYSLGRSVHHPLFGHSFSATVDSPQRRIYLLIQNQSLDIININFSESTFSHGGTAEIGEPLMLYPNQSVSFDNFNAGFICSGEVKVFEAFA